MIIPTNTDGTPADFPPPSAQPTGDAPAPAPNSAKAQLPPIPQAQQPPPPATSAPAAFPVTTRINMAQVIIAQMSSALSQRAMTGDGLNAMELAAYNEALSLWQDAIVGRIGPDPQLAEEPHP